MYPKVTENPLKIYYTFTQKLFKIFSEFTLKVKAEIQTSKNVDITRL